MFAKKCFLFLSLGVAAFAQLPTRDPKAVVATVDGRDVTWAEVQEILTYAPPQLSQYFRVDPQSALMQWYIMQELGRQGAQKKLDEQSPWKEQLQAMRMNYLADAMMNYEMNSYDVPNAAVEEYYRKNSSRFSRVHVNGVYVKFKPQAKTGATSTADIAALAQGILQGAGVQRTEAEALEIANNWVRRLRSGEDVKALAEKSTEDDAVKSKGGDLGYVSDGNSTLPSELVRAAVAMQAGTVSEPVRLPAGFYVLKADERSVRPVDEVRFEIVETIRKEHLNQFMQSLNKRFLPEIKDKTILIQPMQVK